MRRESKMSLLCNAGDDAAKWLTAFLGKPCRLVRFAGELLCCKSFLLALTS